MKLVQLNAWGGRLDKQLLQFLVEQQADIVCLQEAISIAGGNDSGFFLTTEQIAEALNYQTAHGAIFSFNLMNRKASFGNAIFSRLAQTKVNCIEIRNKFKANFDFAPDDYNRQNLLHVELTTGDQKLHILTHHGYHIQQHKNGSPENLKQCQLIADYIDNLEGKIILTGDFNLKPNSASLAILNKQLLNLSLKAKLKTTRNNLTYKTEVSDYIFVNRHVSVKSFKLMHELVSDHLPLILEFS